MHRAVEAQLRTSVLNRAISACALGGLSLLFAGLFAVAQETAPYTSASPSNPAASTSISSLVPRLVRFSGVAKDTNNKPLTDTAGITFLLYKDQQGGAPLWIETQNVKPDSSGRYSVQLGVTKSDGLPTDLFTSGEARWLAVQISGQAEQPRVLLLSVPYALKAADAETIGGLPPSAFVKATPGASTSGNGGDAAASAGAVNADGKSAPPQPYNVTTTDGVVNDIPLWTTTTNIQSSILSQTGTSTINVAGTVNAATGFNLGGQAFAFGSYSNSNAFLGFSGNSTMTGTANTASGNLGLASNTSGYYNTAGGAGALYKNTKGNNNTASGVFALRNNIAGSNNTAMGYNAGPDYGSSNLTNATAIGANATVSESNALVLGGTGSNAVKVGIGTAKPAYTLDVVGAINTSTGFNLGGSVFAFGSATNHSAALGFSTTPGLNGTALGNYALQSNIGSNNTATGYRALESDTTGSDNVANGLEALYDTTGGSGNAGGNNTAVGAYAGYFNQAGSSNTALGYSAGPDSNSTNLTNSTAIGANAVVSESNALVLGGTGSNAISVGIGTATPGATLDVHDNGSGGNTISAVTATASSNGGAVYGFNTATSGNANGGYFVTNSPAGSAIVGHNYGSGGNDYAGYFVGNVYVSGTITSGTITKGMGSFKIDHPLDPANKYLYHSFVESPDMMNIYDGVAALGAKGSVWVTLPEYFEALNQDFRYQLTSVGKPQPSLYVAREISGNRFKIAGGKAGGKVSWQVTGIRHDAYANAHRIQVEVEKPPQEQGHYLHPELFGASAEQAVGYQNPSSTTMASKAIGVSN